MGKMNMYNWNYKIIGNVWKYVYFFLNISWSDNDVGILVVFMFIIVFRFIIDLSVLI